MRDMQYGYMKNMMYRKDDLYDREMLFYYDVSPRIVPAGRVSKITIKPQGRHVSFDAGAVYGVRILSLEHTLSPEPDTAYPFYEVRPVGNELAFEHRFENEEEHYLLIFKLPDVGKKEHIARLSIYSLQDDLYRKRFYRGDLHVHSCASWDAKESPDFLAAFYRKYGFDFFAITDHYEYAPSLECIAAWRDVPVDFKMFPGEEIHLPGNPVHNISFGGTFSVNELCRNDPDRYEREVRDILSASRIPEDVNAFAYASCLWTYRKIKEARGLSVLCHPYWVEKAYNLSEPFFRLILEERPFDALELLAGMSSGSNNLQTSLYCELHADRRPMPIVCGSDSHDRFYDNWFNRFFAVVFSEDDGLSSIIDAILDCRSVAVENPRDGDVRVYGPHRLVKYARFLLRNYFPIHDELCFEEGLQMSRYLSGEEDAAERLAGLSGRTRKYREHCFGNVADR